MDAFDTPKILFIRGVFKDFSSSTVEDESKQISLKKTKSLVKEELKMQKFYTIGSAFVGHERQVCCAVCNKKIPETQFQIFIPEMMEKSKAVGVTFKKLGSMRFHRWGCASYYIEHFLKDDLRYKNMLKKLLQLVEPEKSQNVVEIMSVTSPTLINEYGGDLTREQWELNNDNEMYRYQSSFEFTERTVGQ